VISITSSDAASLYHRNMDVEVKRGKQSQAAINPSSTLLEYSGSHFCTFCAATLLAQRSFQRAAAWLLNCFTPCIKLVQISGFEGPIGHEVPIPAQS
jgi:hypothetical protein